MASKEYKPPQELQKPEVFNDAIYGYIYIDYDFVEQLINTFPMQRLRRIKQLSFVHIVFSCGEHSRFIHSLGVYELARRFLDKNNNVLKDIFNHRDKMLLLTAALLHDVGHGSYSHVFEEIFKTCHEKKSAEIIEKHFQIVDILDKLDPDFKYDVASIIKKENKFQLIEQLLTSQLDFDRLDYLKRDAFFVGVSYGYIDSERLIRSIEIDEINKKIVFQKKNISVIENYLISRYHMYSIVYNHSKVLGFSVIFRNIFKRLLYLLEENYKFEIDCKNNSNNILSILRKFQKNPDDIQAYLNIDDFYTNTLIFYLKDEKDKILSDLCFDFLNRKIWSYLDNNYENKKKIEKINNYYGRNKEYYTYDTDIPFCIYKNDDENIGESILIYTKDKTLTKVFSEESPIINDVVLNKKSQKKQKKLKFFYREY
ncbi:phosphohydrolase [Candidatus Phytoplasma ziziphi]|uniref:Phosphohydrolase n=1 Tax=Ziziphus jujuba witches'-broom phytoplasma TaxID=135727 RepID=A0A660HNG7_ZIZJU|nr:phosphohydrolase [Candidatus Phytoplasma ziziphi]